jgi:uncharacterized membrane protein
VLVARLLQGPERSAEVVIVEVLLYTLATVLATWFAERALLKEVVGYLRHAPKAAETA